MDCLSIIILIASFIASISAGAVPRQPADHRQHGIFNISEFYFSGSPHSTLTEYQFAATDGHTSANCIGVVATGPYISSLPNTCCGTAPCTWSFSFLLASNTSGYILNLTHVLPSTAHRRSEKEVGLKYYPASDVETYLNPFNPNGNFQYLNSTVNFTLPYVVDCED